MKMFILYDGRAFVGNTEDASILDTAETEEEAIEAGKEAWEDFDAIWYEYDVKGEELINEKQRPDLPPWGDDYD